MVRLKKTPAALTSLWQRLLALDCGLAFLGTKQRVPVDGTYTHVDLVFYHRILKCFVLIDLKTHKAKHQDIEKMTLCLNHYKAKESATNDNDPIGIILAIDGNEMMVEYVTGAIPQQQCLTVYQTCLPDTDVLQAQLQQLLQEQDCRNTDTTIQAQDKQP